MNFSPDLKEGRLLKRYKRFFADIEHNQELLTAHVPNTGSLKTVPMFDAKCYFSTSDNPKRKLKYTLEFIQTPSGLAGVNTRTPNTLVHEALLDGLKGSFKFIQPELKISEDSRIDFVLWNWKGEEQETPKKLKYPEYLSNPNLELHFIEVKNVTMAVEETAFFPDGVTARGTKHLNELIHLKKLGFSTEILFVVQRESIKSFSPEKEIDPLYSKTLAKSSDFKVKLSAFKTLMNKKRALLDWKNPLHINL